MPQCTRCPRDDAQLRRGLCHACYESDRRSGLIEGLTDADPARAKAKELADAGWSYREIGRAAGVDRSVIERLIAGRSRFVGPSYKINAQTARTILEIDPASRAQWYQSPWETRRQRRLQRWLDAEQAWNDDQLRRWVKAEQTWRADRQRAADLAEERDIGLHRPRRASDITRQSFAAFGGVTYIDPEQDTWKNDAVCAQVDPEIFFPEKGGSTREAKSICRTSCTVRDECLDYALVHEERFGIWGGYSERERRRIKRGQNPDNHEEAM